MVSTKADTALLLRTALVMASVSSGGRNHEYAEPACSATASTWKVLYGHDKMF